MTEAELIAFLTENLSLEAVNNVNPFDTSDHFQVNLILNGNVISTVTLDVNDGVT